MTGDVNSIMPRSNEQRILEFEKNSWDSSLEEGSRFLGSTKCAARFLKKLCLSLLISKNLKLKKVNKSFVPEPISCFSDSYMRMNIMNILWTDVHFTDSYLAM